MNIRIKTTNGQDVEAPIEKWVMAILVTMADVDPVRLARVFELVDDQRVVLPPTAPLRPVPGAAFDLIRKVSN